MIRRLPKSNTNNVYLVFVPIFTSLTERTGFFLQPLVAVEEVQINFPPVPPPYQIGGETERIKS